MEPQAYPVPARMIAVMEERILHFSERGSGRILDGIHYDRECNIEPMGADQHPLIQPVDLTYEEAIFGGRSKTPGTQGNTQIVSEGLLKMMVAARREYGLVRRAATGKHSQLGVLEWVGRLQDAIEMKASNGSSDAFLEGTLAKPVKFQLRENYMSELTFAMVLEITFFTVPYWRAGRTS